MLRVGGGGLIHRGITTNTNGNNFSPEYITGNNLGIWLDATDLESLTFNSSTISSWRNKGNAGVGNAVQATALNQPLYVANGINGLPALEGRHDGTNGSLMRIADHAGLNHTEFTAFVVANLITDRGVTTEVAGKYTTSGSQREHRMIMGSIREVSGAVSGDGATISSLFNGSAKATVGVPYIQDLSYTTTGPLSYTSLNNSPTLYASAAAPASVFNGTAPYDFFAREVAATESFSGRVGEYIFYDRALGANERRQVLSYLSVKWGVAIA